MSYIAVRNKDGKTWRVQPDACETAQDTVIARDLTKRQAMRICNYMNGGNGEGLGQIDAMLERLGQT